MENLNINIATINGSGSQSANNIIVRSLFRMNRSVTGKNIFPSNIQGLPTSYNIRVNQKGYHSYQDKVDISINVNPKSLSQDLKKLNPNALLICDDEVDLDKYQLPNNLKLIKIPYKKLVRDLDAPIKVRKLLINMIYVGVLQYILDLDSEILHSVTSKTFHNKKNIIEANEKAISLGYQFVKANFSKYKIEIPKPFTNNDDKILIDGNTASAIGIFSGGCSFLSWYPITPSSSINEIFDQYNHKYALKDGKQTRAVIQAEDELSAISMVIGAGWSGARSITCTSGPGLSLMAEAAGLSYFAEIPAVIWNVQRCGPSTGMPTRTQQSDVTSSAYLSHGDTQHILLFPSDPYECFEFGQTCFDLAERMQTLVIVLSDLDLGMNHWISPKFKLNTKTFDRGKIKTEKDFDSKYGRYEDTDKDGITYRTLPGIKKDQASYFTRGTAHDDFAGYSEDPDNYEKLIQRLNLKLKTAKNLVPKPIIKKTKQNHMPIISIITYGTSLSIQDEVEDLLMKKGFATDFMRIRAFPFSKEVEDFINSTEDAYLVEQNNQGQMLKLLKTEACLTKKIKSVAISNGMPISAQRVYETILKIRLSNAV